MMLLGAANLMNSGTWMSESDSAGPGLELGHGQTFLSETRTSATPCSIIGRILVSYQFCPGPRGKIGPASHSVSDKRPTMSSHKTIRDDLHYIILHKSVIQRT